jgi:hypothetical protein
VGCPNSHPCARWCFASPKVSGDENLTIGKAEHCVCELQAHEASGQLVDVGDVERCMTLASPLVREAFVER